MLLPRPLDRRGLRRARAQLRGSGGCRTEGLLRRDPQGHLDAGGICKHLQAAAASGSGRRNWRRNMEER